MNRRITVAILVSVAAALLLAGVGTLVLTRLGARQAAEDDLRRQAEAVADLIALGQQKAGLGPADQAAIRQVVCNDSEPTNLTATAREAFGRLRVVVCAPGNGATGLETARQQLCGAAIPRLDAFLPTEVKRARDAFCKDPTEANLSELRQSYCRADPPDRLDGAAQRRYEQLRRSLCIASRRTPGTTEDTQSLQSTLSKQSIELVGLTADGALAPDSVLPPGLTTADLQPATLRQGLTVSGIYDGNRVYAAAAVNPDAQELSVVVVEGSADNVARRAVPWFLMASGITLLLGAAVAWGLSQRITEPLREATDVTARIADGDLSSRVPEHLTAGGAPRDEVDTLAHSINAMADSLERSRGLEQQFLLSVSHDLRTPLTSIRGYAEAIADGAAPDPSAAAGVILTESRRLERLVRDLLDLAKLDARRFTLHPTALDLAALATDSIDGFRREATDAGVVLTLHAPAPVPVVVDPDRTQQVVANLVENALKYAASQVVVTVSTTADGAARLEVADDGPGIAPEDLPHVFERLYVAQAAPVRKEAGSGLGLAIVRELVEAMGGDVAATVNQPTGTVMVVRLPGSRPATGPSAPA
ncbi:MAG: HAMP domain-containing sensor histidine kinase [Acidimicrobiales bacterium]